MRRRPQSGPGTARKNAEQVGYQLLQKTSVSKEISKRKAKLSNVVNWTTVDVLKRLVTLANEYLHTLTSTTHVRTRDDTGECIGNEVMASNIMEAP